MKFPNNFRQFLPTEAVKQISQFISNPKLADALRDAADKAGLKEHFQGASLQPIQQVFDNASKWFDDLAKQFTCDPSSELIRNGINGTGELFSSKWISVPMSQQQIALLAGSFRGSIDSTHLTQELSRDLCSRTGAQEAILVNSTTSGLAALAAAANHLSSKPKWLLPRQNCVRIPRFGESTGPSIRDVLDCACASVVEVGSNQDLDLEELVRGLAEDTKFAISVSWSSGESHDQSGQSNKSTRNTLLAARAERKLQIVELLLDGSLLDIRSKIGVGKEIGQIWDEGIDVAIVPCEYLIGASEGCIILFREHSEFAGATRNQVSKSGTELSSTSKLLLLSTIRGMDSYEAWELSELGQILTTSSENLLHRAKKMAKQLEGNSLIAAAESTMKPCRVGAGVWGEVKLESGCVRITPSHLSAKELAGKLASGLQPIWCNLHDGGVEIVLRTMSPDDDLEVIQRFAEMSREPVVRTDSDS